MQAVALEKGISQRHRATRPVFNPATTPGQEVAPGCARKTEETGREYLLRPNYASKSSFAFRLSKRPKGRLFPEL